MNNLYVLVDKSASNRTELSTKGNKFIQKLHAMVSLLSEDQRKLINIGCNRPLGIFIARMVGGTIVD
jgi:hypothetical protein